MHYGTMPFFGFNQSPTPWGTAFLGGTHQGYFPYYTPMNAGHYNTAPFNTPYSFFQTPTTGTHFTNPTTTAHLPTEWIYMNQRMDLLCQQVATMTEWMKACWAAVWNPSFAHWNPNITASPYHTAGTGFGMSFPTTGNTGYFTGNTPNYGVTPNSVGVGYEHSAVQIRETENYFCWQIPFQNLTVGDVEVEVLGNRIVCRTKTVVHPGARFWNWSLLPQGMQCFELPDGRVECTSVIPVAFDAKEVEAVFKDGAISIYIPKIETNQRQNVRIGKDTPQYVTTGNTNRKNAELRT